MLISDNCGIKGKFVFPLCIFFCFYARRFFLNFLLCTPFVLFCLQKLIMRVTHRVPYICVGLCVRLSHPFSSRIVGLRKWPRHTGSRLSPKLCPQYRVHSRLFVTFPSVCTPFLVLSYCSLAIFVHDKAEHSKIKEKNNSLKTEEKNNSLKRGKTTQTSGKMKE